MKEKKIGFLKSIKLRDPAARSDLQILLTYPGVKAVINKNAYEVLCRR